MLKHRKLLSLAGVAVSLAILAACNKNEISEDNSNYLEMSDLNNGVAVCVSAEEYKQEDIEQDIKVSKETGEITEKTIIADSDVFNEPDGSASKIGSVKKDDKISIIGDYLGKKWVKVVYGGRIAFLKIDAIEDQNKKTTAVTNAVNNPNVTVAANNPTTDNNGAAGNNNQNNDNGSNNNNGGGNSGNNSGQGNGSQPSVDNNPGTGDAPNPDGNTGDAPNPDGNGGDTGNAPNPDENGGDTGNAPNPDENGGDTGNAPNPDENGGDTGNAPVPDDNPNEDTGTSPSPDEDVYTPIAIDGSIE